MISSRIRHFEKFLGALEILAYSTRDFRLQISSVLLVRCWRRKNIHNVVGARLQCRVDTLITPQVAITEKNLAAAS